MAVDSYGSFGEPQFDETKPSNLASDLGAVVSFARNGTNWTPLNVNFNFDGGTGAGGTMEWRIEDGLVHVAGRPYLGTSPTLNASSIRFNLPVQCDPDFATPLNQTVLFTDSSTGLIFPGWAVFTDTYTCQLFATNATSANGNLTPATATVPFTWAAGDIFSIAIRYRPAYLV